MSSKYAVIVTDKYGYWISHVICNTIEEAQSIANEEEKDWDNNSEDCRYKCVLYQFVREM